MKRELVGLGLVSLFAAQTPPVPTPQTPALPKLGAPKLVEASGAPITTVTGHAAPFVVDYDGDGKRDLIVGMYGSDVKGVSGGTGRFYKNVGSNAAPKYEAFVTLMAKGRPIAMESS